MANLTVADQRDIILDRLQANVATDGPFSTAEILRRLNEVGRDLWTMTGSGVTKANHAALWTPSPATVGTILLTSVIANFKEILHLFISDQSGSTGMEGDPTQTTELRRMEMREILHRRNTAQPSYGQVQGWALERPDAGGTATDVGKINVHLWPAVQTAGRYFPAHYSKTFTALSGDTSVYDGTEAEQQDMALIVAARIAPLEGRAEFVPGLLADVSDGTANAMAAKLRALFGPRQRDEEMTT